MAKEIKVKNVTPDEAVVEAWDVVKPIDPNDLTKEQKKKIRKLKFKYYSKLFGIGAGIAAVSATVAYFVGKHVGAKELDDDYTCKLYDLAASGKFASKIDFTDGTSKYLLYNVVDDKPDWWDTAKHQNISLAGDISKLIEEG